MANRSKAGSVSEITFNRVPPTHDEVAVRAYELFLERGGRDGSDLEDWLQAERELQERAGREYVAA